MAEVVNRFRLVSFEKFLAEMFSFFVVEEFATEDVNEGAIVVLVIEVHGNTGGLDKLHGGVASEFTLGKAFDEGWPMTFHIDVFAEGNDKFLNLLLAGDLLWVAFINVD